MADYCIEVLLDNLNDGQQEGVVVGVFPAQTQGTKIDGVYVHNDVVTAPRTRYVYVTDVPEKVNLKERLLESDADLSDPENPVEKDRRKYDCRFDEAMKTAIKRDKIGAMPWNDLPVYDRVGKKPADKKELEDKQPIIPELPGRGLGRG